MNAQQLYQAGRLDEAVQAQVLLPARVGAGHTASGEPVELEHVPTDQLP